MLKKSKITWLNERHYAGMLLDVLRKRAHNLSRWPSCRVLKPGPPNYEAGGYLPGRDGERVFKFSSCGPRGVVLTTHPLLAPRLRMSRAIPLLSL
jgi:hypothetical protein